jgi:hypothetical protein
MSKALKRICLVITEPYLFFGLKPRVTRRLNAFQAALRNIHWSWRAESQRDIGTSDRHLYSVPVPTFASNVIAPIAQRN